MDRVEVNIFWFRRDLRLEDNRGLYEALSSGLPIVSIFIFDQNILDQLEDRTDHRVTFIHDTLEGINEQLSKIGSRLITFYSTPLLAYEQLTDHFKVNTVYANKDYEPYAKDRDLEISSFLQSKGALFQTFKDHVILEEKEVVKKDGLPYTVFTPYKRKWLETLSTESDFKHYESENLTGNFFKFSAKPIISLSHMKFQKSTILAPSQTVELSVIQSYDKTRNFPSNQKGTSKLGVHLRFGTISIRSLARAAMANNDTYLSELVWRDFYSQILANFPHVASRCFRQKYEAVQWENNESDFEKWCKGETGYPMVDAGMRELNTTGHMHNRVRMVVASFLTKHLLIDYKWGEAYFANKLFDFDLASNNGGWQWAAGCGTDAAPYFRVFNPTSQLEKFDKNLVYTKKWVPEFGTFDYPRPMVDHKVARQRCLDRYKEALG